MPIRIAAIGVGHWHSLFDAAYLKAVLGMPDAQLVGLQDPQLSVAVQRAGQLGDPPVFTDHREMLLKTRPDFVIALGRHDMMAGTAHFLLDEGYPFLMEKPMGLNALEVRRIADKAAAKGAYVAVPLFQRYHPFVLHARRMQVQNLLGPVSHFCFRSNRPASTRYVSWGAPWMLDPAAAGGGCLRNIGLHGIDLFLHITGEDAHVTGAQVSARVHDKPVEDYATVLLRTAGGVLGTVEVGNVFPGTGADAEWRLTGRDAMLVQRDGAVCCTTAAGAQQIAGPPTERLPIIAVRDALARWKSGQPPAAGVEDCYRAMQLIDQAYEVARS